MVLAKYIPNCGKYLQEIIFASRPETIYTQVGTKSGHGRLAWIRPLRGFGGLQYHGAAYPHADQNHRQGRQLATQRRPDCLWAQSGDHGRARDSCLVLGIIRGPEAGASRTFVQRGGSTLTRLLRPRSLKIDKNRKTELVRMVGSTYKLISNSMSRCNKKTFKNPFVEVLNDPLLKNKRILKNILNEMIMLQFHLGNVIGIVPCVVNDIDEYRDQKTEGK